jgi:hypothetical protein
MFPTGDSLIPRQVKNVNSFKQRQPIKTQSDPRQGLSSLASYWPAAQKALSIYFSQDQIQYRGSYTPRPVT